MTSQDVVSRSGAPAALLAPRLFDPADLCGLPEPAQRWLRRAIAPNTPLYNRVHLTMHGTIRVGRWRAFTATQELEPDTGFIWAANTRMVGLPVSGYDAFMHGEGRQHWRLLGLLPVQSADGLEVTRSAADRLAAECALLPTSLLGAQWRRSPEHDKAIYLRRVAGRFARARVTISVDASGQLRQVAMARWGTPPGARFGQHPFRVQMTGEQRWQGVAIPSEFSAAWRLPEGTWLEFIRAHIDAASLSGGQP